MPYRVEHLMLFPTIDKVFRQPIPPFLCRGFLCFSCHPKHPFSLLYFGSANLLMSL